ncbi:MAG TPA: N-acetylmuramoyl-L-alanine amidase [Thermoanaerobaculia bacterium]|jgi:N-acetylmuramoyl-L-alanine amidase
MLPAATLPKKTDVIAAAQISPELRATLTRDYELEVTVTAHAGDAWTRLAKRVTGDAAKWEDLAAHNQTDEALKAGQQVRVPYELLRHGLQRDIVKTLFPIDRATADGWQHIVVGARGVEGESLWKIAEWFTGDGANYTAIRKANPTQGLSTRKGDVILVPRPLLTAAFGGGPEARPATKVEEKENAPKTAAEVRQPEVRQPEARKPADDQIQRASADESSAEPVVPAAPPSLSYVRYAEPHAVYKLQKGEALYSSVAIRFTGRVYSKDVGDVLDRIVKFNAIEDVARLPVGYPVKIPMELLLPEYLPQDDPARVAREEAKRDSQRAGRRTRAAGLTGVVVVLDAGHGGRDVGTEHEGVYESTYVYDVACRLRKLLESRSAAKVSMTTKSKKSGFSIPAKDVLADRHDHYVQTTPKYVLEDAVVGVNLRWYLANSMFARAMKNGTQREKVVFLSIHADSLHPSIRGAMAYIPGQQFVEGTYQKKGEIYLAHAEVRERPVVTHSRAAALEAEGLSRGLAESVLASFTRNALKVHPFNPVRDNVVRGGKEWVPAIIRHNLIPTRLLLEVGNLGNRKDRELMQTQKYREELAQAIYEGLLEFFARDQQPPQDKPPVVAAAGK